MQFTNQLLPILLTALASSIFVGAFMSLLRRRDAQVSHEKDDYIAMLVHDIRAPLTVIKGSADILMHETTSISKEDTSKLLKQIVDTSDDLLSMVTDILDVSKMESGKFEINKAPSDLNMLLQLISDKFLVVANKSNIKLQTNFDTTLPKVPLDQDKIERVVNNLLSNSIKFTPEGGNILISSNIQDGMAKVCVADTGIGVPDNMKNKLFNKFVQAGKTIKSSSSTNTGLGLKVSKEIIELHKGKIWIEDNKPQGAAFIFTLPLDLPSF